MTVRSSLARRPTVELLGDVPGRYEAVVTATEPGIVAGIDLVEPARAPGPVGRWARCVVDGDCVDAGAPLLIVEGSAREVALAEDHCLGVLGFAGGIARRGLELRAAAPPGLRVVCGGWKKLPAPLKPALRAGLDVAGLGHRLVEDDFVYLAKTHVRLLGSVEAAVRAARRLEHGPVAVQVTGVEEAVEAVTAGCRIVMVDTGRIEDAAAVHDVMVEYGVRDAVTLAFGGGVGAGDLVAVARAGVDIVDVGRAVLDAPLWDLHLEVMA